MYGERTLLDEFNAQKKDNFDTMSVNTAPVAQRIEGPMPCISHEADKRMDVSGPIEEVMTLGGAPQPSEHGEIMDGQPTQQPRRPYSTPSWPPGTPRFVEDLSIMTLEARKGNAMLATEARDGTPEPTPPPPNHPPVGARVGSFKLGGNGLEVSMQEKQSSVIGIRPVVTDAARRMFQQCLPAVRRSTGSDDWDDPPPTGPSLCRLGAPTTPAADRIPTAPAAMRCGGAPKRQNSAVSANSWDAPGPAPSTPVDGWETVLHDYESGQPKYVEGTTTSNDMASTLPTATSNIPAAEVSTSGHHSSYTIVWDTAPTAAPTSGDVHADVDLTTTGFQHDDNGWDVASVPDVSTSALSVSKASSTAPTATAQDDRGWGITSGPETSTSSVIANGAPTSGDVSVGECFANTGFQDDNDWAVPSVPEGSVSSMSVHETSVTAPKTPLLSGNKAQNHRSTETQSSATQVRRQDPDLLRLEKRRAEAARRESKMAKQARLQRGPQAPRGPGPKYTAKAAPSKDKVITEYKGQELFQFCAKKILEEIQHPELSSKKQYPFGSPGWEWHKRQKDTAAYIAKLMEENGIKTEAELATAIKNAQVARHVEFTPVLRKRQVEAEEKLFELKQKEAKKKKTAEEAANEKAKQHAASEPEDARTWEDEVKGKKERQKADNEAFVKRTSQYGKRSRTNWILLNKLSDFGESCEFAARSNGNIGMNLVQIDMSDVKLPTAEEVTANVAAYVTPHPLDPRMMAAIIRSGKEFGLLNQNEPDLLDVAKSIENHFGPVASKLTPPVEEGDVVQLDPIVAHSNCHSKKKQMVEVNVFEGEDEDVYMDDDQGDDDDGAYHSGADVETFNAQGFQHRILESIVPVNSIAAASSAAYETTSANSISSLLHPPHVTSSPAPFIEVAAPKGGNGVKMPRVSIKRNGSVSLTLKHGADNLGRENAAIGFDGPDERPKQGPCDAGKPQSHHHLPPPPIEALPETTFSHIMDMMDPSRPATPAVSSSTSTPAANRPTTVGADSPTQSSGLYKAPTASIIFSNPNKTIYQRALGRKVIAAQPGTIPSRPTSKAKTPFGKDKTDFDDEELLGVEVAMQEADGPPSKRAAAASKHRGKAKTATLKEKPPPAKTVMTLGKKQTQSKYASSEEDVEEPEGAGDDGNFFAARRLQAKERTSTAQVMSSSGPATPTLTTGKSRRRRGLNSTFATSSKKENLRPHCKSARMGLDGNASNSPSPVQESHPDTPNPFHQSAGAHTSVDAVLGSPEKQQSSMISSTPVAASSPKKKATDGLLHQALYGDEVVEVIQQKQAGKEASEAAVLEHIAPSAVAHSGNSGIDREATDTTSTAEAAGVSNESEACTPIELKSVNDPQSRESAACKFKQGVASVKKKKAGAADAQPVSDDGPGFPRTEQAKRSSGSKEGPRKPKSKRKSNGAGLYSSKGTGAPKSSSRSGSKKSQTQADTASGLCYNSQIVLLPIKVGDRVVRLRARGNIQEYGKADRCDEFDGPWVVLETDSDKEFMEGEVLDSIFDESLTDEERMGAFQSMLHARVKLQFPAFEDGKKVVRGRWVEVKMLLPVLDPADIKVGNVRPGYPYVGELDLYEDLSSRLIKPSQGDFLSNVYKKKSLVLDEDGNTETSIGLVHARKETFVAVIDSSPNWDHDGAYEMEKIRNKRLRLVPRQRATKEQVAQEGKDKWADIFLKVKHTIPR